MHVIVQVYYLFIGCVLGTSKIRDISGEGEVDEVSHRLIAGKNSFSITMVKMKVIPDQHPNRAWAQVVRVHHRGTSPRFRRWARDR